MLGRAPLLDHGARPFLNRRGTHTSQLADPCPVHCRLQVVAARPRWGGPGRGQIRLPPALSPQAGRRRLREWRDLHQSRAARRAAGEWDENPLTALPTQGITGCSWPASERQQGSSPGCSSLQEAVAAAPACAPLVCFRHKEIPDMARPCHQTAMRNNRCTLTRFYLSLLCHSCPVTTSPRP